MAVSDVVVSCSTDPEAFGRVTLEALAIGKPVAAYSHGGVAEQLEALLPKGKILVGDIAAMVELLYQCNQQAPIPNQESTFTLGNMLSKTIQCYSAT